MTKEQFINAHPNIKINNTMFLNEDGFRDFTEEELINLCSISFDNASKLFMYIYMYDYEKYYKKMLITISKTLPLFFDISNINDINENSFDDKKFDYNVIFNEYEILFNKGLINNVDIDYKKIYMNFYTSEYFINNYNGKILPEDINYLKDNKIIKYEDACLFVYIKGLLEGFGYKGNIKEVVIDEAQDYSFLQYKIIKQIFKSASFTILGDVNQTINPYYMYESLNKLSEIFEDTKYLELTKTYRSSPEIIEYTNKILNLNHVSAIRDKSNREEKNNLLELLTNDIETLFKQNLNVSIITKDDKEAKKIYELLKEKYEYISLVNSNTVEFSKKLLVIPSYVSKGLEFDSAIIYTEKDNKYTKDEKNLFYVACTRTQHQLIIYNQ